MFLRQRYKLLTLQKVPNEVGLMLKLDSTSKQLEFTDDGDMPPIYEGEESMGSKITIEDAQNIAQLVTEIDIEQEKGVEALYHILSVIQDGGSSAEAVAYCVQALTPKKKRKK